MSAAAPGQGPPGERRKASRYRPAVVLPVTIGRQDAVLADLSVHGACVYHFAAIRKGEALRFTIHHGAVGIICLTRVVSSRLTALGNGPGGAPTYESHLQFTDISPDVRTALAALLTDLQERQDRRMSRNAEGQYVEEARRPGLGAYFLRLDLVRGRWHAVATHRSEQPPDGMTIPADTAPQEQRMICEVYLRADAAGRRLIQAIAEIVCETILGENGAFTSSG